MELRHLRTFLAIAEEGSITAASQRLHTTQPALTRQLAQLEASLGAPLFIRVPTGMRPTAAGDRLITEATRLLADADNLVEQFRSDQATTNGSLSIAIPEEALGALTPIVMAAFNAAFPNVDLDLDVGCPFHDVERLTSTRTTHHDLALWMTSDRSEALRSHDVYRQEVMLATSSSSERAQSEDPLDPRDLLEVAMPDGGDFLRRWCGVFYLDEYRNGASARLTPTVIEDAPTLYATIEAGTAITGMTTTSPTTAGVTLKPLTHRPTIGTGVIHPHTATNPYVRPFTQVASEVGARLWHLVESAAPPAAA